jgi:predicted O-methyltransferase YrrM
MISEVAGKVFTYDWASVHFPIWEKFISSSDTRNILEVGCFEGRATVFFLEHCPGSCVTCIDAFLGSKPKEFESHFDANTAAYGQRVEKIKEYSVLALHQLVREGRLFDVIYIDCDHRRDGVLMDSLLAWKLLKDGGLLMWDDYLLHLHLPMTERPKQAIDIFLNELYAAEIEVVHMDYMVIVRKRAVEQREAATPSR